MAIATQQDLDLAIGIRLFADPDDVLLPEQCGWSMQRVCGDPTASTWSPCRAPLRRRSSWGC